MTEELEVHLFLYISEDTNCKLMGRKSTNPTLFQYLFVECDL